MRRISHSEIQMALTCQARWDFAYGGHLSGGHTFRRRQLSAHLSNGRAWGAAAAAWHAADLRAPLSLLTPVDGFGVKAAAHEALVASYAHDVATQAEVEVFVPVETQVEKVAWLGEVLDHYMSTAVKLPNLTRLEDELDIAIPSRTGKRASSKYHFNGFIDGFTVNEHEHEFVVEFKLRDTLTPPDLIQLSRQVRWYAWSRQQETGLLVAGVLVDERLAEAPKPPRIVKAKRKSEGIDGLVPSHAVDQLTTPEYYKAVCEEFDVEPHQDTLDALERRRWQQRVPIMFSPGELEEAGRELVSAAQTIRDLDTGQRYPVRNAQPQLCRSCRFKEACASPSDDLYLETLFIFTQPKRLREPEEAHAA